MDINKNNNYEWIVILESNPNHLLTSRCYNIIIIITIYLFFILLTIRCYNIN